MPQRDIPTAKAVIFDMDGTLVDTLQDLADATNKVLEAHALPTHPVDPFRYFVGSGVRELMLRAMPQDKQKDAALVTACVEELKAEYMQRWDKKAVVYDGVQDLIASLLDKGVPLAVCTNKPQQFATLFAERFFPDNPFAAVIGPVEGTPTKPNPFMPMEAARSVGVEPAECAFMGDSSVDMRTAVNAGMLPVGCLWGFRDEQELLETGAKIIISHPMELLERVRFAV